MNWCYLTVTVHHLPTAGMAAQCIKHYSNVHDIIQYYFHIHQRQSECYAHPLWWYQLMCFCVPWANTLLKILLLILSNIKMTITCRKVEPALNWILQSAIQSFSWPSHIYWRHEWSVPWTLCGQTLSSLQWQVFVPCDHPEPGPWV